MCGIFCSVSFDSSCASTKPSNCLCENLTRRGPDNCSDHEVTVDKYIVHFTACVLHMRGETMTAQPLVSKAGNVLLWNGEIFGGVQVDGERNDTSILLQRLEESSNVPQVLSAVEGPWAFCFYQRAARRLWYGRDYFGRRSLLWARKQSGFVLSSVGKRSGTDWLEVPANGIFCLDLNNHHDNAPLKERTICFPWLSITSCEQKPACLAPDVTVTAAKQIRAEFANCISREEKNVQPCQSSNLSLKGSSLELLVQNCESKELWNLCDGLLSALKSAVMNRTRTCRAQRGRGIGILFSGGLDCTVLAALTHMCVPENEHVDLINVAFAKPDPKSGAFDYSVPDRVTGLSSFEELRTLFPKRKWNFVQVNTALADLQRLRTERIADLAHPKDTVLDDSIACALWFAARGAGFVANDLGELIEYRSNSRILLCGMGADEQLGGYSRHRGLYEKHKDWSVVDDEIKMEIERIASRNLGRDDRVVSDHGKEARFPYLDERVVAFLLNIDISSKCELRLPRGVGEKILLRGAAYLLGFRSACVAPKRAIQFGSRIAKAESRKEKGGDTCARLLGNGGQ